MRWLAILISAVTVFSVGGLAGGFLASAHVSTAGTVLTNASLLPSGSMIHAGDVIATGADGMAIVTSGEIGRLEVRPSSRVEFGVTRVGLRSGVVAADKAIVELDGYTIQARSPQSPGAWFAVASTNGRKLVAAHRGDVLIARSGTAPLLVPAGSYAVSNDSGEKGESENSKTQSADSKTADAQASENEEDDHDCKKKDRGCAAAELGKAAGKEAANEAAKTAGKAAGGKAAETVAKTAGWTIGSLSHAASVAAVTVAGAAVATGTTLGVALNDEPVSPAQ